MNLSISISFMVLSLLMFDSRDWGVLRIILFFIITGGKMTFLDETFLVAGILTAGAKYYYYGK